MYVKDLEMWHLEHGLEVAGSTLDSKILEVFSYLNNSLILEEVRYIFEDQAALTEQAWAQIL